MVLNTLAFNENIVSNYPNVANSSSPVCQWQAPPCPRHLASHVGEETALGWSRLGSGEKIENNSRKGDKKRTERDLKLLPVTVTVTNKMDTCDTKRPLSNSG